MPNFPVYKSTVPLSVGPLVKEKPSTGVEQGIGALAEGIGGASAQIGDLVQKAVYGQELDQAKVDYAKMREGHIAEMRENPLVNNVDENGRLLDPVEGFGNLNEMRTKAWKTASTTFLKEQKEKFSHGRASQDFTSWATAQNENARGEINQQTITEQLEFVGAMRSQNWQDAIDDGQFDLALQIAQNGYTDGAFSLGTLEEMRNATESEREYQNRFGKVMSGYVDNEGNEIPGYSDFEDSLLGIQHAYSQIESMNLSSEDEERMLNEVTQGYQRDDAIDKQLKARASEKSWESLSEEINTTPYVYETMLRKIWADDNIDAGVKEHLTAMLGQDPSGSSLKDAQLALDPIASEIFNNPHYTSQQVKAKINEAFVAGDIIEEVRNYFNQKSRDDESMMNPQYFNGRKTVSDAFDYMIAQAEKDKDWDGLQVLLENKARTIQDFETEVSSSQGLLSAEDILSLAAKSAGIAYGTTAIPKDLTETPSRSQGLIADMLSWSDLEKAYYFLGTDSLRLMEGYTGVAESMTAISAQSEDLLANTYKRTLTNIGVDTDAYGEGRIEFTATNLNTNTTSSYRWHTKPGQKRVLELQVNTAPPGAPVHWEKSSMKEDSAIRAQEVVEAQVAAEKALALDVPTPQENLEAGYPNQKFYNGIPENILFMGDADIKDWMSRNDIPNTTSGTIKIAKQQIIAEGFDGGERNLDRKIMRQLDQFNYPEGFKSSAVLEIKRMIASQGVTP